MRLGQLARKISLTPSEIVAFLSKQGVTIDQGANARVEDAEVKLVLEKFAPHLLIENIPVENIPLAQEEVSETYPAEVLDSAIDLPVALSAGQDLEPAQPLEGLLDHPLSVGNDSLDNTNSEDIVPEVIKVQKIELKGLKVVGKIELPEPKKKEVATENVEAADIQSEEKQHRKAIRIDQPRNLRGRPANRSSKNPIALERERQQREAEILREQKIEEEKERRKQYYANRVKPSAPSKSIRLVEEQTSTLSEEAPDKPKGIWGRFVHWLTTY